MSNIQGFVHHKKPRFNSINNSIIYCHFLCYFFSPIDSLELQQLFLVLGPFFNVSDLILEVGMVHYFAIDVEILSVLLKSALDP